MSVSKKFRLHLQRDFDNILKDGQSVSCPEIVLKCFANNLDCPRLAVIVSKKTAKKAVLRNKLKRQIKEIIRPKLPFLGHLDLIFILKLPIVDKTFTEIKQIVEKLLQKVYNNK